MHSLARVGVIALVMVCAFSAEVDANAGAVLSAAAFGHGGWPGDGLGNGKNNHNSFIIDSPSFSHDIQHIRNVNVGGNTVTPAALCKKHVRRCKIIQHLVVVDP
jgi:hypothetical protein